MSIRRTASVLCAASLFSLSAQVASAQTPPVALVGKPEPAPAVSSTASTGSTTSESQSMPRLRDLFTPVSDMKRMITQPNFVILGVGAGAAMLARPFDGQGARAYWSPGAREALQPGQLVGSFAVQAGAGFATYFVGRATHNANVATVGADLFRANILAQTTTQLVKFATQRTRPDGTSMSFPSGHASASFATATVLQSHFGWKAGIPAYAMASWVAASRVQRDRHYISDVVAGATLGILAGRSVTVGRGHTRFAVSPMAAPGGVGVSFTRIEKK